MTIRNCPWSQLYEHCISLSFQCKNGKLIPISLINNGIADCPFNEDETFYPKPELNIPNIAVLPAAEKCIYDRNNHPSSISHCLFYECPHHFKCSNTYCILPKYVCDNVYDCPEGDDETESNCSNITCHHMFLKLNQPIA